MTAKCKTDEQVSHTIQYLRCAIKYLKYLIKEVMYMITCLMCVESTQE